MSFAKLRDVDMVLLAGDLFHDNKQSRKSTYKVMRSLSLNYYGELVNMYHFNKGEQYSYSIPSGPRI